MVYAVIDTNIFVNLPKQGDSFLVTGNLKHFPKEPQVITAAEMMEILNNEL